ncbi:hypothetical protein K443DRAFT_216201 [Laccaria amethystina LaAM-08-1]|uniref:Uncharacterized protein n=1 Tax=Laccaria amethystina LaAM-08-1 TaxID=1095629 RepID=A0A0C9X4K1_9AGAR|nr:hypothetical protein K443DRAFT_216201 [Laccaria amethystina LaAM-08-1]
MGRVLNPSESQDLRRKKLACSGLTKDRRYISIHGGPHVIWTVRWAGSHHMRVAVATRRAHQLHHTIHDKDL